MCIFLNNQLLCNHKGKGKYGGYCYKHRRNYLVNDHQLIDRTKFTGQCSDYLKKDIIYTISRITNNIPVKDISTNKQDLFKVLVVMFHRLQSFHEKETLSKIIYIQRFYKQRSIYLYQELRGEGFLHPNVCNNETDFFTYETHQEIDPKYFFSYKDSKGFIWFFDIRSFIKLIEMNQTNPYTREELPEDIIENATNLFKKLGLQEEEPEILFQTREKRIHQKTIDIFSKIEQFGYECNFQWFLRLRRRELRNLYKNLEDIWNYRLQLTYEIKSRIAPPNGLVFTTSFQEVMGMDKQDLQELILQEILKFDGAVQDSDKKLGFMYFIIGLGSVSLDCHNSHPWLLYV